MENGCAISNGNPCMLCPRGCGVRRGAGQVGRCGAPARFLVCRAAPHYGEEPCISGVRGSGAVFFGGCALGCVFCQNHEISRGGRGRELTVPELRELLLRLRDRGVHNINLVTPSHYSALLAEALSRLELGIPVVWNSSGYERVEQLRQLEGLVQVYMPDYKFAFSDLAARYCGAPDYPEIALDAIREMYRQTGPFLTDCEGILRQGVLIRHLVLPGAPENTLRVIDAIEDHLPAKHILFSLMGQYTPMPGLERFPELQRGVTEEEYGRCRSYLEFSSIAHGYVQELSSAGEDMIPEWNMA
ncbi:MAG: radical SAM protein [Oscillospiraceae bacterium]|nr:radical SAM protein [Oscillospiraceae bacterium]